MFCPYTYFLLSGDEREAALVSERKRNQGKKTYLRLITQLRAAPLFCVYEQPGFRHWIHHTPIISVHYKVKHPLLEDKTGSPAPTHTKWHFWNPQYLGGNIRKIRVKWKDCFGALWRHLQQSRSLPFKDTPSQWWYTMLAHHLWQSLELQCGGTALLVHDE